MSSGTASICERFTGIDTSNFDVEFTSEPVVDSVVQTSALSDAKGADFDGFTFTPDSAMG